MKATLKDGSIVEVKNGLDWGLELGITMLDPDGFFPRNPQSVKFDSLMTESVYMKYIVHCTCNFSGYTSKYTCDDTDFVDDIEEALKLIADGF